MKGKSKKFWSKIREFLPLIFAVLAVGGIIFGLWLFERSQRGNNTVSANADYIEDENEEYEFIEIPLNIPCSWQVGSTGEICAVRGPSLVYKCSTGQVIAYRPAYASGAEVYIPIDTANPAYCEDFFIGYIDDSQVGQSGVYFEPQPECDLPIPPYGRINEVFAYVEDSSPGSTIISIVVRYSPVESYGCSFEIPQFGYYNSPNELKYSNLTIDYCRLTSSSLMNYSYGSGYNNGYDTGMVLGLQDGKLSGERTGYENGYNEGEEVGYENGYHAGYVDGEDNALLTKDTITDGFFNIIDAPFKVIRDALNFEIFGINVSNLVFFILTAIIIALVLKFLWGLGK